MAVQCGAISSLASMLLSTCSEVADAIGPWAVYSTCSEGQVVCRRAMLAGPNVWGTCSVSLHQHDFFGAPNDHGVFGSWLLPCWQSDITPYVRAPLVLTGCAVWGN